MLRIEDGKTLHQGDSTEFLVSRYENGYQTGAPEFYRDRELQGIWTAKRFGPGMLNEQLTGPAEMLVTDDCYQEPPATKIGFQTPACHYQGLLVNVARPKFERQHGFHLKDGESRDEAVRTRFGGDPVYEFAPEFFPVKLRQCAGIEEVSRHLAIPAFFYHRLRQRTAYRGQGTPDLIEADRVVRGICPLVRRSQQRMITGDLT